VEQSSAELVELSGALLPILGVANMVGKTNVFLRDGETN
jgi:hypothetical protein